MKPQTFFSIVFLFAFSLWGAQCGVTGGETGIEGAGGEGEEIEVSVVLDFTDDEASALTADTIAAQATPATPAIPDDHADDTCKDNGKCQRDEDCSCADCGGSCVGNGVCEKAGDRVDPAYAENCHTSPDDCGDCCGIDGNGDGDKCDMEFGESYACDPSNTSCSSCPGDCDCPEDQRCELRVECGVGPNLSGDDATLSVVIEACRPLLEDGSLGECADGERVEFGRTTKKPVPEPEPILPSPTKLTLKEEGIPTSPFPITCFVDAGNGMMGTNDCDIDDATGDASCEVKMGGASWFFSVFGDCDNIHFAEKWYCSTNRGTFPALGMPFAIAELVVGCDSCGNGIAEKGECPASGPIRFPVGLTAEEGSKDQVRPPIPPKNPCGDRFCDAKAGEDSTTCPIDCGTCPQDCKGRNDGKCTACEDPKKAENFNDCHLFNGICDYRTAPLETSVTGAYFDTYCKDLFPMMTTTIDCVLGGGFGGGGCDPCERVVFQNITPKDTDYAKFFKDCHCGNGIVDDPSEECDDGPFGSPTCSTTCEVLSFCGDKACRFPETCSNCPGDCGLCPPGCVQGAACDTKDPTTCGGDVSKCKVPFDGPPYCDCGGGTTCESGKPCSTADDCGGAAAGECVLTKAGYLCACKPSL